MSATSRKHYDHRIRQAIVMTGDTDLFPRLDIPDFTRRSWLSRGVTEVVTLSDADSAFVELHARIAKLERKNAILAQRLERLAQLVDLEVEQEIRVLVVVHLEQLPLLPR